MQQKVNKGKADYDIAISYIRCIAMSMIIICHFFQFYDCELAWWFNVGVQIFFVVSGFLYGKRDIKNPIDFILKQAKKILVPYYIFLVPVIILYVIFARETINLLVLGKAVLLAGTIYGIEHLWFVSYILFCYFLTPYLYWIKQKEDRSVFRYILKIIIILSGFVMMSTVLKSFFSAKHVVCFLIGYFLSVFEERYGEKKMKNVTTFFAVGCILINGIRVYFKYLYVLPEISILQSIFRVYEAYAHVLLGVTIFLVLHMALRNMKTTMIQRILDKYSFYIYLVHQLFILSPFSLMNCTRYQVVNWIVVVSVTWISGYILYHMDKKTQSVINNKKELIS